MGWYGIHADFKSVKDYADQELKIDKVQGMLLERSIVGNTVYSLVHIYKDDSKLILVDMVRKDNDGYWMHKPLSENCGPTKYDCPERILKQSTSENIYAVQWREQCRQLRRDKAKLIKLFKELKPNTLISTSYGKKLKFVRPYNKSFAQIVCLDLEEDKIYRYSFKSFNPDQIKIAMKIVQAA